MDEKYTEFTPVIRIAGALAPSGSGTFPVARACDIMMPDNSRLDAYLENMDSGGSGDPTTVWELNALPDVNSLPNTDIFFTSNEMKFSQINKIYIAGTPNKQSIRYVGSSTQTVYTVSSGWSNQAYRTITIHEEITNANFYAWLKANATLISGGSDSGGSGLPPYTDADNGKFLRLVDGEPTWVLIPNAEETRF